MTEFSSATPVVVSAGVATANIDAELEKGATIGGTVTAAATGLPVADVEACAFKTGFERCALTNGAGQYTILGLPAGTWEIYFYTGGTEQDLVSAPYPTPVSVATHGAVTGINAALTKGGQIGGTVRLAATGAPLAGVRVCLVEAPEWYALACLKTPASGGYRFVGLSTYSYKVVFSPEDSDLFGPEFAVEDPNPQPPDAYPTQWWNSMPTWATADSIAVTAPAVVSGIDGSLGPPPTPPVVAPTPAPAPPVVAPVTKKAPLVCRKGFTKHKVKGSLRCVKAHKKKHHRRHHGTHRPR